MAERVGGDVVGELRARLGSARVVDDPDVVAAYRHDQAALTAASAGQALAVVRAASVDDVVAVLEVATASCTPVVTRGAGTGLAGGANAIDGCIVLSMAAMDEILEIDSAQRTATVQAGVLNADLAAAAARVGLWYPPDPASRAISTIGGNVATNAGGSCCLKYGVTGDHVAGLKAVLADGTVIRTGARTRKDVAGFDLTRLLVGSEGALAVVVEATLRLRPAPAPPSTLVAFFATLGAAGDAVVGIERVAEPSLLELMDRTTIGAVEAMTHMGLDTDAAALLVVQSDSVAAADEIDRCARACTAAGATYLAQTADPEEGEQFLAARRAALPALERLGTTLLDDIAVPKPLLTAMLDRISQAAGRRGVVVGTFGHAGDGNLHPTLVFDAGEPSSVAAARLAFDDIVHAALDLGGTVTGEHGVGSLKLPYLDAMLGPAEQALMARIKSAFDPHQILNPGRAITTPRP